MNEIAGNNGEIVMYQPDETIRLEVRMGEDTVWISKRQRRPIGFIMPDEKGNFTPPILV